MSSTDHNRQVVLFRFSKRQYLEEFRRDGLVYMNTLRYFSTLESDSVRGDRFEDTDEIHQPSNVRHLRITDNKTGRVITFGPNAIVGPLLIGLGRRPVCNVFCMFAITDPTKVPLVDERAFEFGDSFVVILNTQEFINRIRAAAERSGLGYSYRLVEYYDETGYSGETGPFRKPARFAYQQEFRFLIEPGSRQPIALDVGSLEDITTPLYPLAEINRIVEFRGPDGEGCDCEPADRQPADECTQTIRGN